MRLYAKDTWSQKGNLSLLSNSMKGQQYQIETEGRVEEKRKDKKGNETMELRLQGKIYKEYNGNNCYELKSLELDKRTKLLYQSKTQENSIRSSIQSRLPYIPIQMVHANYCALYPKPPCVRHEVNIQCTCCMMLLLLEPFTSFSYVP